MERSTEEGFRYLRIAPHTLGRFCGLTHTTVRSAAHVAAIDEAGVTPNVRFR